jgi:hypothetical protein
VDQEQVGQTINSSQVLGPVGGNNNGNNNNNPADQQQQQQQEDQQQDSQQTDSESDSSDSGDSEQEQGQTVGDFLMNPMGNGQVQLNEQIEQPITSGSDLIIINNSLGEF